MQQKLFYISCVVDDECNLWVFTSSGVWHRRSKSNMEWMKSEIICHATTDNEDNLDCLVQFCKLYEGLYHDDVMILWRDTTTLIQMTNNNKPRTHQTTIHRCDMIDKQYKYICLASKWNIFVCHQIPLQVSCRHQLLLCMNDSKDRRSTAAFHFPYRRMQMRKLRHVLRYRHPWYHELIWRRCGVIISENVWMILHTQPMLLRIVVWIEMKM